MVPLAPCWLQLMVALTHQWPQLVSGILAAPRSLVARGGIWTLMRDPRRLKASQPPAGCPRVFQGVSSHTTDPTMLWGVLGGRGASSHFGVPPPPHVTNPAMLQDLSRPFWGAPGCFRYPPCRQQTPQCLGCPPTPRGAPASSAGCFSAHSDMDGRVMTEAGGCSVPIFLLLLLLLQPFSLFLLTPPPPPRPSGGPRRQRGVARGGRVTEEVLA